MVPIHNRLSGVYNNLKILKRKHVCSSLHCFSSLNYENYDTAQCYFNLLRFLDFTFYKDIYLKNVFLLSYFIY